MSYNIHMHVIKKPTILEYCERYPDAREQLLSWHADAKKSIWSQPLDIKEKYGTRVDFISDKVVVFDIKGTTYRLVVRVEYLFKKVFIRWFGPHDAYDEIDVTKI